MQVLHRLLPQIVWVFCLQLLVQQRKLAVFEPHRDYESNKLRLDRDVITGPNNGFTLNYIYGFCDSSKCLWLFDYQEVKNFFFFFNEKENKVL